MIPGVLLSAFPHRQFHTLPGLLDSWAALPNSNPNACMPMQGGSLHHFYDGLWYDLAKRRTHDLPCERRTRYRLVHNLQIGFSHRKYKLNKCRRAPPVHKHRNGSQTFFLYVQPPLGHFKCVI